MHLKALSLLLFPALLLAAVPIHAQELWTDEPATAMTFDEATTAAGEPAAEEPAVEVPAIEEALVEAYLGPYRIPSTGTLAELALKSGKLILDLPEVDLLDLLQPGEGDDPNRWAVSGKEGQSVVFQIEGESVTAVVERPEGNLELVRDAGLIVFDLQFEDEKGPAPVRGMAGDFEYQEGEYLLATGGVRLRYRQTEINAQRLRIDIPTDRLTAEGSIWIEEGKQYLAGDTLELDLEANTGKLSNAWGRAEPEFFFSGREIIKVAEKTFTIIDGELTSCTEDVPDWSFALGKATVTVGEYAHIRNARMKLKNTPIFWVPRLVWPATTERTSGFLIPKPTYSNRRGAGVSMAYYQTLGRSADATFFADITTDAFWAIGNEFRYTPSVDTKGVFEALFQNEPDLALDELYPSGIPPANQIPTGIPDEQRWKVRYLHETSNLWGGWRGVVDFEDYSDPVFRLDLERDVGRQTNSFIYSRAYLTRNVGQHSFNLMVDQRERVKVDPRREFPGRRGFVRTGRITDTRKQLPEIEYRLRPTKLGEAPIYFGVDAGVHYLSIERLNDAGTRVLQGGEYGRIDLFPNFSIPLSTLPWLSAKLDVGARGTYYSNSVDPTTNDFHTTDHSVDRTFGIGGLEVVGPSFSRIFEKENTEGSRFSKFKHIIEPRIVYAYRDSFNTVKEGEPEEIIPLFDEVDNFELRNQANFSITNRLLAKPTDESKGGGFEIASFELSLPYSFDESLQIGDPDGDGLINEKSDGPVHALLRFNPTDATSLKADVRYGTLFDQLLSFSLSGNAKIGEHGLGISLFTNWNNLGETVGNQARFTASFKLTQKFAFDAAMSFDLENTDAKNPLQQRYVLRYQECCFGWMFEFRESNFGEVTDRDFLLSFSLKNVGSFIDLRGSLN